MTRALWFGLIAGLVFGSVVKAQHPDVTRVLSATREALGGEAKLSGVRTILVEGTRSRPAGDGTSRSSDFEMAFGLPDRFMKKEVMANVGGMIISRASGFNADDVIDRIDQPPAGGHMTFRMGPGSGPGTEMTPEQEETVRRSALLSSRQEFTRLALGMFAASFDVYPVEFAWAGVAESPDGKADMIDVAGADGFTGRLFIDQTSHLPLMLSWNDKEPLSMVAGGGPQTMTMGAGSGGSVQMARGASPEDIEKLRADLDARMAEAEARRRVVEYRVFYTAYRDFDGIKLPTRIQRMIDGQPVEELEFDDVKVNVNIDPKTFDTSRHDER